MEELAKNGAGLHILSDNNEEPTEISVQIAGVIHDESLILQSFMMVLLTMKMLNQSMKTMARHQLKLKK